MADRSDSGLEYRQWIEDVVRVRESEGRISGPLFCDLEGRVAQSAVYERVFLQVLADDQEGPT